MKIIRNFWERKHPYKGNWFFYEEVDLKIPWKKWHKKVWILGPRSALLKTNHELIRSFCKEFSSEETTPEIHLVFYSYRSVKDVKFEFLFADQVSIKNKMLVTYQIMQRIWHPKNWLLMVIIEIKLYFPLNRFFSSSE